MAEPPSPRRVLPSVRGLPRSLWVLCLGMFVNRLGGFVAPFLAIYLTRVRLLSVERTGLVVSLLGLGAFASGPIGGHMADRFGRRPALALASALGGTAMLGLGFARSIPAIAIASFVLGLCGDLYRPTVGAMVADLVPPADRARAFGFLYWAVNLGFSASLMAAGFLANRSFTLLFVGDAITTFAFGALVCALVPETRPAIDHESPAKKGSLAPYRDRRFMAFCFLSLCVAAVFLQGQSTMPIDLRAQGISNQEFGALLSLNGIFIVLVQPFAAGIVDRFSRGTVLAAGALLTGFGFAICGIAHGAVPIYVASVVMFTLGEIAMAPVTPSVVAEMFPRSCAEPIKALINFHGVAPRSSRRSSELGFSAERGPAFSGAAARSSESSPPPASSSWLLREPTDRSRSKRQMRMPSMARAM